MVPEGPPIIARRIQRRVACVRSRARAVGTTETRSNSIRNFSRPYRDEMPSKAVEHPAFETPAYRQASFRDVTPS